MNIIRKILHNIVLAINVLVAIMLVISNFAVFVSPAKLWIVAILGLAYPYLLIVNIVFALYWAVRLRLYLLISVISILIGWGNFAATVQPRVFSNNKIPAVSLNTLRVLTYNVRAFNRFNWVDNKEVDDQIWDLIKNHNPDIICFQEFYMQPGTKHSLENLLSNLKPRKYYAAFFPYNGHVPYTFGLAVFSKFPIIKKNQLIFKNTDNTSMFIDVVAHRQTIRVFNNHLQSIKFIKGDYDFVDTMKLSYDTKNQEAIKRISYRLRDAFKMRAQQVDKISEQIQKSPYPVIVCGDFNDSPVSYTYYKMKGKLKDSFRNAGYGTSKTYIGKFPSYRIDYIFYSKQQFNAIYYKRITKELSDHYPVFTVLQLN